VKRILFPTINLLISFFMCLAAANTAHAYTRNFEAMVRRGDKLVKAKVQLTDLLSQSAFDGKYFAVTNAQSDEPLRFDAPKELVLKAATVYYWFTQSHLYFAKALKPLLPKLPPEQKDFLDQKMVVRLEMTRPFSAALHYDLRDQIANGAVTIPASNEFRDDDVKAWGPETWFFTAKEQKVANPATPIAAIIDNGNFKLAVFESLAQQDALHAIQQFEIGNFAVVPFTADLIVSLALAEVVPSTFKIIKWIPSHIYLDAAMIPEISANEYSHYALSPWLGIKRRFHVGEGYAHFFAAKLTGLIKLQNKGGRFSRGYTPIRGDSSDMYSFAKEVGASAAMSSFTFSVLEDLEKGFGADGLRIILDTLPYLNENSNLKQDFTLSVFTSINDLAHETGKDQTAGAFRAHDILSRRGF